MTGQSGKRVLLLKNLTGSHRYGSEFIEFMAQDIKSNIRGLNLIIESIWSLNVWDFKINLIKTISAKVICKNALVGKDLIIGSL